MFDILSNHYESVRTLPSAIWPQNRHSKFHPTVNLHLLEKLTRRAVKLQEPSKKRSLSPEQSEREPKRVKTAAGTSVPANSAEFPVVPGEKYPTLDRGRRAFLLDPGGPKVVSEDIAVLRHVFSIHYNDLCKGGAPSNDSEARFAELIREVQSSLSETTVFRIGEVRLHDYSSRVVAGVRTDLWSSDWLLLIPTLGMDPEDHDYGNTPLVADLPTALLILRDAQKTSIEARVSLVLNPADANMTDSDVPFQLDVEITASLRLPYIFQSLSRKEPKKNAILVENAQRRFLDHVYGRNATAGESGPPDINISHFYSILRAAKHLPSQMARDAMQPVLLNPTLLPFQRRSVGWLLEREGMEVKADGSVVPSADLEQLMYSFWDTITEGNHTWHYNRLSGELTPEGPEPPSAAFGGILAEEPGLGKTLETISLILLNPPPESRNPTVTRWDPEARLDVKAIKSTLIVTPPSLASQWIDEIRLHAPSLRVLVYDGWSKVQVPITRTQMEEERLKAASQSKLESKASSSSKKKSKGKAAIKAAAAKAKAKEEEAMTKDEEGNLLEWCDYVHQFDVVITTYQVLKSDLNVARAVPVRPRREDVVYVNVERPRSPLVMVEWNRVIMDEVQMVGGGKVEDMVSLIPRLSSFAVSGTPAKAEISDMIHVLKFLRVDNTIGPSKLWHRLLRPGFSQEFASFFQTYAVRTTKASVKQELTIPQQTRYLVPIELGRVERHVYDQTLEAILLELGLDARGVAASEGWQVDPTLLRSSIRRLRGICTHPQVGQLQNKNEIYKRGALKTMDAVLQNMRDQNWRNIVEHWKGKIQDMVRYAQLIQRSEDNVERHQLARQTLDTAERDAKKMIEEINAALTEHREQGEILKREAAARRSEEEQVQSSDPSTDKGKGKAIDNGDDGEKEDDDESEDESEENVEDKGLPKTPAGKEHRAKTGALKARLREAKLALHRVKFLQGDLYHIMGNEFSKYEDEAYEEAERIRRDLLQATEDEATRAMASLQDETFNKRPSKEELEIELPYLEQGGIRSSELFEEVNTIIENVLNEQTDLLWEWRGRIMELLTEKLNAGEEADGQEYQRNLDNQGEAEVYLQAYSALLADRREALVNERTLLAAHDAREKRMRHTKAAIKAARALEFVEANGDALKLPEHFDVNPEYQVQYKEMSDRRKELVAALEGRAIKSVLVELNGINARLIKRDDPEKQLITDAVASIRRLMSGQGQLHDRLEADLALMRRAFNERILYFRQLQEISDSVGEVEWEEETLDLAIQASIASRAENEAKMNTNRARHRYLVNLASGSKGATTADDEENICILCRCDFLRGFITQCAHIFCEGCMKAWLARREGKTCPVCRVPVDPSTVQRFTISGTEEAPKQPVNGEAAPQSRRKIVYNNISADLYDQIQSIESYGDYGSKIQTLVRHLLYLQSTDPGTKSIVFSAWADSLHIVEWALNNNGIRCLRIDQKSKGENAAKRFRTDPEILVLLLHGERENAGLNVTCASRVFLLESVVHHSFELQAIARIDRMGQTRPTEVYCYYAEDTVERNILDLAARKGLSLYTQDNSAGTLDVSSFAQEVEKSAVDSPAKKRQKGDFIFKVDDMLAALFPHMYEDIEFLIPQEGQDGDVEMDDLTFGPPSGVVINGNALPGPSRLR